MPPANLDEFRSQVAEIICQHGVRPHVKLAEICKLLDVPRPVRGRPPLGGERLSNRSDYQRQRRQMLSELRRCWACERPNDRWPKTHCARCSEKRSARYRKQRIMQNLESTP